MSRPQLLRSLATALLALATATAARPSPTARDSREIEGWTVHVSIRLLEREPAATTQALDLLAAQLRQIVKVLPPAPVAQLRKVPLWVSEEYAGVQPKAEYHPDPRWLEEHQRDPAMAKAVEFTNVRIFEAECHRMPVFVLHELAHAYHDRVLGFENAAIKTAYQHALKSGAYDSVQRRDAKGRISNGRAYALTNEREYFAECSEAYFGQNDFFPFTRAELAKHDPEMFQLLARVWGTGESVPGETTATGQ